MGGMELMTILALMALVIFGVTFSASCIWLAVRLNNRGGPWARVSAACCLGLPIPVVGMIFGPIVWMVLLPILSLSE